MCVSEPVCVCVCGAERPLDCCDSHNEDVHLRRGRTPAPATAHPWEAARRGRADHYLDSMVGEAGVLSEGERGRSSGTVWWRC